MRLIHVVPAISEEASGPAYSVVRLCEALIAEGHQLTLAALDWSPMPAAPAFLKAFPIGRGPRRLGRSPSMARWLSSSCDSGEVDILHSHGMWQMNSVYPSWASRNGRVPLVQSPRGALSDWAMQHGSRAKRVFWPLLQRPALRRATCLHATAESEYRDIRRLGLRQPVAIIPNGIDVPDLPERTEGASRTLLYLSRIHKIKGLENLLRAWRSLQDRYPEWQLVIAGGDEGYHDRGGYLDELRALSQELGIERIEFPGPLYGTNKMNAFREADLFVLPTHSENFGMVVAEALSMATPAIVSKGAPWSGLEPNGAGWWIDIGVDPLIACLEFAMARSPAELAAMGMRGREWMQKDFSWGQIGRQMGDTYRWLRDPSLPVPAWVRSD